MLRILDSQDSGIVTLNQELIAALLACSLFCLFPTKDRGAKHLPNINFDYLFATLNHDPNRCQEQKLKCYMHYFERISKNTPNSFVSFERKILPLYDNSNIGTTCTSSHTGTDFWSNSTASLCPIKIFPSGSIENQQQEALEVIFSNKVFGGNALSKGCVQEQIRFMINPELVAGMFFIAPMRENESIEIVGIERYTQYTGYGSSFRFEGDYMDTKAFDKIGRRKTRVLAMDALRKQQQEQYEIKYLLREANKALCGFMDAKYQFEDSIGNENSEDKNENEKNGIATGNWGCGVFGGDPQIKSMIQWIAASQANRPFINYYTFNEPSMHKVENIIKRILNQKLKVGELWQKIVDFSSEKLRGDAKLDFFSWILPEKESNILSGSKRDSNSSRNDDRPDRAKRRPVWLKDFVTR